MKREFDDFDDFAEDYRNIHNKSIELSGVDSFYFAEHKVKELKNIIKEETFNFLDFGCGDGITSKYLHKWFKNANYTGIDISIKSVEQAQKQHKHEHSIFQQFDGKKIPFKDNSFDYIFTACVFHHINFDLHKGLMQEILRVLKPNGKFFIFEHNPYNPITRRVVNNCPFDEDAVLLKESYTRKTLKTVGFKKVKSNFIVFFPNKSIFKWFIPLEKYLTKIPIGGQYFTIGEKY